MSEEREAVEWAMNALNTSIESTKNSISYQEVALQSPSAPILENGEFVKRIEEAIAEEKESIETMERHRLTLECMLEDIEQELAEAEELRKKEKIEKQREQKPTYIKNVDLSTLPVGTLIYVHNGVWRGTIIEEDGVKYLQVDGTDRRLPAYHDKLNELNVDVYYPLED